MRQQSKEKTSFVASGPNLAECIMFGIMFIMFGIMFIMFGIMFIMFGIFSKSPPGTTLAKMRSYNATKIQR